MCVCVVPQSFFLESCVDKLTQTPVIFTPGMQGARERDRAWRIEERKTWREKMQGRGWQEMTTDMVSRKAGQWQKEPWRKQINN